MYWEWEFFLFILFALDTGSVSGGIVANVDDETVDAFGEMNREGVTAFHCAVRIVLTNKKK